MTQFIMIKEKREDNYEQIRNMVMSHIGDACKSLMPRVRLDTLFNDDGSIKDQVLKVSISDWEREYGGESYAVREGISNITNWFSKRFGFDPKDVVDNVTKKEYHMYDSDTDYDEYRMHITHEIVMKLI